MKNLVIIGLSLVLMSSPVLAASIVDVKEYKWDGMIEIPDNDPGGAYAEIFIPADSSDPTRYIADLDVDLIISHTWQGDLQIALELVERSMMVMLMDRPGSPEDGAFGWDNLDLGDPITGEKFFFDDEAAGPYDPSFLGPFGGIDQVTGNWQPENPLSVFDGLPKWGTWRLWVWDNAQGDVGEILNFSLHMTNVPEPASLGFICLGGFALIRRRR